MTLGAAFDEVLDAARTGAEWALSALYRDIQPVLLGYLRSLEPTEAEDLAAEVWRGVGAGLVRFEGGEDAFRGWVFTISRSRVVDWRRQQTRRRTDPAPDGQFVERPGADDTEGAALSAVESDEAMARIRAVLPADQAEVVILRVLVGLDAEEVGRVLGKKPGTVRVLQHRALRRLAQHFSQKSVTP